MAYNPVVRGTTNTNNNNQNDAQSLSNMNPDDYLGTSYFIIFSDKSNVNIFLKEAISLLLENRPENPILFLADQ